MRKPAGIIALDLDGTLLNSRKELTERNRRTLARASEAGWEIVPTTGRFFDAMPAAVRRLPFLRYAITINGARVEDLHTGETIYRAEIPAAEAVDIMGYLDGFDLIYDCYQCNAAFMTGTMKNRVDETIASPHYRKMVRELRQDVPELKAFVLERPYNVQKVQLFTARPKLRLRLLEELPRRFAELSVSSSIPENVEINHVCANKGQALLALARHLAVPRENTVAFGDGLNDLSMIESAGIGVAMANSCPEILRAADCVSASCDDDGVGRGIETICLKEGYIV